MAKQPLLEETSSVDTHDHDDVSDPVFVDESGVENDVAVQDAPILPFNSEEGAVYYLASDEDDLIKILQDKAKFFESTKISKHEIELARSDLRLMACVRAGYEAYSKEYRRVRDFEPKAWYTLMENEEVTPIIALALGALKAWRDGMTGQYERPGGGSEETGRRIVNHRNPKSGYSFGLPTRDGRLISLRLRSILSSAESTLPA